MIAGRGHIAATGADANAIAWQRPSVRPPVRQPASFPPFLKYPDGHDSASGRIHTCLCTKIKILGFRCITR